MVNNFRFIEYFLKFDSEHDFYMIQILKRRKENPSMKNNTKLIRTYYIYSLAALDKLKDRIIELCQENNARAYIRLNRRNAQRIALHTQAMICRMMLEGDYKNINKAYDKACGKHSHEPKKRWIVDIDTKDQDEFSKVFDEVTAIHTSNKSSNTILGYTETPNGFHLITEGFNVNDYKKNNILNKHDLKKEANTILFAP